MTVTTLRLTVTWNAKGLVLQIRELEIFLHQNKIDIAMISETHHTKKKNYMVRNGYKVHLTPHRKSRAHAGSATPVKNSISHSEREAISLEYFQSAVDN